MSTRAAAAPIAPARRDSERGHRIRLYSGYALAIALFLALAVYGADYYTLGAADRPFSPKHALLKPSGAIGVKLGIVGFVMFLVIFLYPLRKHWTWLLHQGNSRHWLDIHVMLGLTAPFVIAFHSSFKFRGFAGIAFWIMVAVSLSGVVGRYLYAQIPRSLNAAEISLRELQERHAELGRNLAAQKLLPADALRALLRLPSPERVEHWPAIVALSYMIFFDVAHIFRVARVRRRALRFGERVTTLGGFVRTGHVDLERAIATAREEAALAKRVVFLDRAQQVFHLWHVVHKPFSYSFALLALSHIVVVVMMGYF